MKYLIASDIHGDLDSAEKVINAYTKEECDGLILLGDILYHGPRNDLPKTYNPKAVIALLNTYRDKIIAVRGNCDAEVDQMVLDFPIMDDFRNICDSGLCIFTTHGHHFNTSTPPALSSGDILLHGHTHVPACIEFGDKNYYINPGSCSIPKENNPRTYLIYEKRTFTWKTTDGEIFLTKKF